MSFYQEELDKLTRIKELMEEKRAFEKDLTVYNKIKFYKPYQKQKDFHAKSALFNAILLMGGNQLGKTLCGAAEMSYHLTGLYPDWWEGKRFPYPIQAIAGSVTFEMTMAGIQTNLLGKPADQETWGTASLPKNLIVDVQRAGQPKNFVSTIIVKHASGLGNSTLKLTCYAKGRESWQAAKADLVWFDEEPPEDVYQEGLTRLKTGSGPDFGYPANFGFSYVTFTPLQGPTSVVNGFYPVPASPNKTYVMLGINDVEHYTPEQKISILSEYLPHEREARAMGLPLLGSGAIFSFDWTNILVPPMEIPKHWLRINGIDFGFDHPSAAVSIALDRDSDTVYVINSIKARQKSSAEFATLIRNWGGRWSWPHDGAQHDKGSGITIADQYKAHGLDMLPERATHDGKSNSLEASLQDLNERFESGRLYIFDTPANQTHLMEELRQYHRKEGKPVAINDDAISAMRYAIMMVDRFGVAPKTRETVVQQYRRAIRRNMGYQGSGGSNGFMSK